MRTNIDIDDELMTKAGNGAISADFPDITPECAHIGAAPHNLADLSLNCMAKGKVLYDGHPVAAVEHQLVAHAVHIGVRRHGP